MTDKRRKAFEEWWSNKVLPVDDSHTYYTKEALEWSWNAAIAYMESRLDSPKVVERVVIKAQDELQFVLPAVHESKLWDVSVRIAKAALAALKGSL